MCEENIDHTHIYLQKGKFILFNFVRYFSHFSCTHVVKKYPDIMGIYISLITVGLMSQYLL